MMKFLPVIIWTVVIGVGFLLAWRAGYVTKAADYVRATREELKKCNWPSWNELKVSTVLVMTSLAALGLFTVGSDFLLSSVISWITTHTTS